MTGYEKYYATGWLSGETGGTPITPEALNHMEQGIAGATAAAAAAAAAAQAALPKEGGTLTGILILTEGIHYGDTLPETGEKGRIFFKKVST